MTLAQALIGEHVSPRERGRFAGYFATVFALATTTGPVLGAYLTEHLSWRAVFLINVPLGLVAAVLSLRVPHTPMARRAGPVSTRCRGRASVLLRHGHVPVRADVGRPPLRMGLVADVRAACRRGDRLRDAVALGAPPPRSGDSDPFPQGSRDRPVRCRRACASAPRCSRGFSTCRCTCSSDAAWALARPARCCCRSRWRRSRRPRSWAGSSRVPAA